MAIHDYACANDLLTKSVCISMRRPGRTIEVYGQVVGVTGSVPNDCFAGSIHLHWQCGDDQSLDWYPLDQYVVEYIS